MRTHSENFLRQGSPSLVQFLNRCYLKSFLKYRFLGPIYDQMDQSPAGLTQNLHFNILCHT